MSAATPAGSRIVIAISNGECPKNTAGASMT